MRLVILICTIFTTFAYAAINVAEFETAEQSQRYQKLIDELRCLVCQNQTLADSNAELAIDLKKIVQQKIITGETDDQILQFMTDRYGDFVLYRPPFKSNTLLLWLGPAIFLVLGLLIVVLYVKRSKQQSFNPSEQQRDHARELLDSLDSKK